MDDDDDDVARFEIRCARSSARSLAAPDIFGSVRPTPSVGIGGNTTVAAAAAARERAAPPVAAFFDSVRPSGYESSSVGKALRSVPIFQPKINIACTALSVYVFSWSLQNLRAGIAQNKLELPFTQS